MKKNMKILKMLPVAILVMATACNGRQQSEQSEQPSVQAHKASASVSNQVDVLFVIDTKEAMSAWQKALADQIPGFLEALNRTGVEYQIAVTTMDMSAGGEKGRFIGARGFMNQNSPDLGAQLATRLYIGDYDWKPLTKGFEAVKSALSGLNTTSGPNAGFLRPNAMLSLIFLSKHNDRSNPEDYAAFFDKLRPSLASGDRTWEAEFLGVTPDDQNCKKGSWANAEPGLSFIELAQKSGGAAESICNGDVAAAFDKVKEHVVEKVLARRELAGSMSVTLNTHRNGLK